MRYTRTIITLAAALALASCGGAGGSGGGYTTGPTTNPGTGNPGGTGNPNGATGNTVTLSDNAFNPGTVTVPVNTTVTWNWPSCDDNGGYGGYGGGCVAHNILFDDGSSLTSGTQSSGTYSRTFATKGTFKYHCVIHGTGMAGQVVVQ